MFSEFYFCRTDVIQRNEKTLESIIIMAILNLYVKILVKYLEILSRFSRSAIIKYFRLLNKCLEP